MPWVRLDDRFPSHRKIALLSDRAFRLHISAICWCAENLTDGHIADRELPLVAHIRGIKATAKQLEEATVWDRVDGGWVIHDYLDYNPSREQVQAERKRNAERQERFRRKKNGKSPAAASDGGSNAGSNGVTRSVGTRENSTTATRQRHDGDTNASPTQPGSEEEPQVSEFRNGVTNAAPTRPVLYMGTGRERGTGSSAKTNASLSQIPAGWQPSADDQTAAAGDLTRLGAAAVRTATDKFVRHHQSRGTTAADFGPLWVTWLTRERPETQGSFLVGLVGGATPTPPSFAEQMAALDAAAEADRRRDRGIS